MYQLFRSLAYIHSLGICHRDIKPQNLLLDPESGILKLCDFGSAKHLVKGEPNVSYICSRYYRAPELIFGAIDYTTKIGILFQNYFFPWIFLTQYNLNDIFVLRFSDVWSAGCVLAELLLGQPIFPGDSGVDQLVEIIKVLGTPTREQIREMNPNYTEFKFPQIKSHPWTKVTQRISNCIVFSVNWRFLGEKRDQYWRGMWGTFPSVITAIQIFWLCPFSLCLNKSLSWLSYLPNVKK